MCVYKKNMLKKDCEYCKKKISEFDKYVLLGTYLKPDLKEETYFHFLCFRNWFENKVKENAQSKVKGMQSKAQDLLENLGGSGFMSNVLGVDKIKKMLGKEININVEGELPKLNDLLGNLDEKNKDGRNKPRNKGNKRRSGKSNSKRSGKSKTRKATKKATKKQ